MRDRLRNSRGLKGTETGQRFLEGSRRYGTCDAAERPEPATWCLVKPRMSASGRPWLLSMGSDTVSVGPEIPFQTLHADTRGVGGRRPAAPALNDFPNSPDGAPANALDLLRASRSLIVPARKRPDVTILIPISS
jgi:hypothetical protein